MANDHGGRLHHNPMPQIFLLAGLAYGVWAACTSIDEPSPDLAEQEQISPKQKQALMEFQAELDMGRNMAGRLLQQFKPLENKELTAYITKIGLVVAAASPYAERAFVFGILDSDMINAFAMPGGYILISRGTIERAENEAELAGIIGHEIAHVGKRHIYNATLSKMKENEASKEGGSSLPESVQARKRPEAETSATAAALANYIGGSVGGQFNILSAVQGGVSFLLESGLDPKLENEADIEGVSYAFAAGYEPRALVQYFKRVLDKKGKSETVILEKTHPSTDSRIKTLSRYLASNVPQNYRGAQGKERFDAEILALKR